MKIKLTSTCAGDQDRALRSHTGVLGFVKKNDFTQGIGDTRPLCHS